MAAIKSGLMIMTPTMMINEDQTQTPIPLSNLLDAAAPRTPVPESLYRRWLDPEFEVPLQQALAKVEADFLYSERITGVQVEPGSQEWNVRLDWRYRDYLYDYVTKERPVIPFVEATDEQLQEWAYSALLGYKGTLIDDYGTPTPEWLQELWQRANKEASTIRCSRKSDRQSARITLFQRFVPVLRVQ